MPYTNQLFIGKITNVFPSYDTVVYMSGNTTLGQNTITNLEANNGDINLLRVGMGIQSFSSNFNVGVTIISIESPTQITLSETAVLNGTDVFFGANTKEGQYLIQSASFIDGQNLITVNDITGSLDIDYNPLLSPIYGVIGAGSTSLGGSLTPGKFFSYKITEKIHSDLITSKFSAFIEWAAEGSESDSGYVLYTAYDQVLAIGALSDTSSYQNIYDPSLIEGTPAGSGVAAYQIAIPLIDKAINTPFPFTGSAQITGSLAVTGSSKFIIPVGGIDGEFSIKSGSLPTSPSLFSVNGEGTIQFFAYDNSYTPTPILGGIYFTSQSLYVGLQ